MAKDGVKSHNRQVLWEACSKQLVTLDFGLICSSMVWIVTQ